MSISVSENGRTIFAAGMITRSGEVFHLRGLMSSGRPQFLGGWLSAWPRSLKSFVQSCGVSWTMCVVLVSPLCSQRCRCRAEPFRRLSPYPLGRGVRSAELFNNLVLEKKEVLPGLNDGFSDVLHVT